MENVNTSLQPGERIVGRAKLHAGAVIVPIIVLLIGAAVLFLNFSPTIDQFRVIAILVFVVGLWTTFTALSTRLTTQLVLSDERMFGESGLFPHKKMTLVIRNLDSVQAKRGILGMLLGYGTLVVNARGQGNLRVEYPQIVGAEKLAEQIRSQMAMPRKPAQ